MIKAEELIRRNAEYYAKNREEVRKHQAEYYAKNREEVCKHQAVYREGNREVLRQKAVERRAKNREQKKFFCEVCQAPFSFPQNLRKHNETLKHQFAFLNSLD